MNQHYPYRCTLMTTIKETPWTDPVEENPFFNVYRDKYAVTDGHTLYVPKKDEWYYINKCLEAVTLSSLTHTEKVNSQVVSLTRLAKAVIVFACPVMC